MSKEQFRKIIERELQEINKKIDLKILRGESYKKEAHEHKLLRRKMMQNNGRYSIFSSLSLMFH